MTKPLYYAISALPFMGNKWGAPNFCFGEDHNEVLSRAARDTCGDHPHSPVVLAAGVLPPNLAAILAKVPTLYKHEFEARLGGAVYWALHTRMIKASFLTAFHDEHGRSLFSPDEIADIVCFIMGVTQRGQEILAGRDVAIR